ncbi:MAG TPA: type II CAAX endopeptidase family protein [Candidatus Saccharimonadales bacterium]|nr:type II CAAX endopeptidase family protein [Candidatus Saccharimonadales bacterium]
MEVLAVLGGVEWGIPFYLMGLYGAAYFIRQPKEGAKQGIINWSPLETVSVAIAIYFVSQLIGGLLVYIYPLLRGWSTLQINAWFESNVYGQFFLVLSVEALAMLLLWQFLKRRGASFKTIGLRKSKWLRDVGYVLLGFGVYFVLYVALMALVQKLIPIDVNQRQQIGFSGARGGSLIFVFMSLVLLPPIAEELLIRGFLYSGLKKGLPTIWAALGTSALFAMAHLQAGTGARLLWVAAIDTFVLSLVLIFLREKTGSLHAPIGLHMLKNSLAFLSLFVFRIV